MIRVLLWLIAGYALHSMYVNSYLAIKGRRLRHYYWLVMLSLSLIGSVLTVIYSLSAGNGFYSERTSWLIYLFLVLALFMAFGFIQAEAKSSNFKYKILLSAVSIGCFVLCITNALVRFQLIRLPGFNETELSQFYNWGGVISYALLLMMNGMAWIAIRHRQVGFSHSGFLMAILINTGLVLVSGWQQDMMYLLYGVACVLVALNGNLARHIVHDYEASRKLKDNEFRWRAITDHSPLIIIGVDKEGAVFYCNNYLYHLTHLQPDDLLKRKWLTELVSRKDKLLVRTFSQQKNGNGEQAIVFQLAFPNGQKIDARWILIADDAHTDGEKYWIGTMVMNQMPETSHTFNLQRELDTFVNIIPGMFILFSKNGRIERMNKQAIDFFDNHCPEISGKQVEASYCGTHLRCKYCIVHQIVEQTLNTHQNVHRLEGALPVVENDLLVRRNVLVSTEIVYPFEKVMVHIDDITHLKQCEAKLRLTEDRYETLLQEAPIGIILHKDSEIHYGNPEALKLLEYQSEEELLGKSIFDFVPEDRRTLIAERISRIKEKQVLPAINLPVISSKGKELVLNFISTPIVLDGEQFMMSLARDNTDLVNVKRELEKRNELLEEAGDIAGLGRWEFDLKKQQFSFSAQWGQMIVDTPEEQVITVDDLLPYILKQDREEVKRRFTVFVKEKYFAPFEFRIMRKDKRIVYLFIDGKIELTTKGVMRRLYGVFQDITTRKVYEEEIIKTKEKAVENDRLKTAFLANLSHEIRTPLNGILGFTEVLKKILESDDHLRYIDVIQESSHQLLHILSDILDYSLIETDQLRVAYRMENINELIMQVYERNLKKAGLKHLDLTVYTHLPDDLSWFKTDKQKLYRILDQLVSNAIKFTFKGTVRIGYRIMPDSIRFYVSDTGIGIEEDKQQFVFKRFWQVDMNYNRQFDGTGLGLSVAKGFVDAMKGHIWMKSTLGMGTTFYIEFPFEKKHEQENDSVPVESHR